MISQYYPLWCAELADNTVTSGRVLSWSDTTPPQPVVAWQDDTGQVLNVATREFAHGDRWFLGDTRTEAVQAAREATRLVCPDHKAGLVRTADGRYGCPIGGCLYSTYVRPLGEPIPLLADLNGDPR